jgi:hypothetical protein
MPTPRFFENSCPLLAVLKRLPPLVADDSLVGADPDRLHELIHRGPGACQRAALARGPKLLMAGSYSDR